jgi:hypothetical protein
MKTGTEDKKKIYILIGLMAVIIPAAIWEISGMFGSSPKPTPPPPAPVAAVRAPAAARPTGPTTSASITAPEAQKITSNTIDPTLHFDKLAASEEVEYEGTGRNIFSATSVPLDIPKPISNGRTNTANVNLPPPPPSVPQAPAIDLKYFGYSQSKDKSVIKAFLIHGDDIFMARTGEIVDHRYKVGAISPGSIQITDMSYNNTQSLPLTN